MRLRILPSLLILTVLMLSACQPSNPTPTGAPTILAIEPFLADLVRNVAGDRLAVDSLIPSGLDPHAFEPTPQDVVRLSSAPIIVMNGAGLETWLEPLLKNLSSGQQVITASAGLTPRTPQPGEFPAGEQAAAAEIDPHFWLNPLNVIRYVENIRDGLIQADPAGKDTYSANAAAYIEQLKALDAEIQTQVEQIPPARRLLVTNHESFGYFADRYGFKIIGAIIPSVTTGSSPSARELAALVDAIRASEAPAIFLETGSNPNLADQIAAETGVKVVTDLYTHSFSALDGPASTYLDMMRYNANRIVEALK